MACKVSAKTTLFCDRICQTQHAGSQGVAPIRLLGKHARGTPLPRTVTFPAVVVLMLWCVIRALSVDALAAPLERVEFASASQPLMPGDRIQGSLAKPDGPGPFPAVIGLHGCGGMHAMTQQKLADDLVAAGYGTLLVDSFAPRGIAHACTSGMAIVWRRMSDAYGALALLARQSFVDIRRVAAVGFSQGGWVTLLVADTRVFVAPSAWRFRAAVAFYPLCRAVGLRPGIPTLILIGAADDWTPAEDCARKVASWGAEGPPIELVVYPGTHHGFYYPHLQPGRKLLGHWVEYNGDAADNASVRMRQFLHHHLH
jgi:dienelactone hydrolase